ncbi:hypothetical protein MASR2M18_18770 [Ignavibacteria bacterium]|nr:hypothetical protein [Bacteroidota bacterium]
MKWLMIVPLVAATLILASCSNHEVSPVVAEETGITAEQIGISQKSAATIADTKTGERSANFTVPANPCGVPTDCIWVNYTQWDITWNNKRTKSNETWQATGYSYDCSSGNASGSYSYANPPSSTGRTYQITRSTTSYFGRNNMIGWPTKVVWNYTVKLLPNGPTVSWTYTWPAKNGVSVSNVRCN